VNEKRRITRLLVLMVGMLGVILVAVELPARAEPPTPTVAPGAEAGGGNPALVLQATPRPTDVPDSGDDSGDPGTVTVIERHTIWKILFPYETLGDAVKAAVIRLVDEMSLGLVREMQGAANRLWQVVMQREGMFQDVRRDVWRVTIVVAGILMPLSLMVSVASALKEGTTSVTGYASAREGLLSWVISIGAAVSSYFLLSKAIELSAAGTAAIAEGLLGSVAGSFDLGDHILGSLVLSGMYVATPGIGQLFLSFFGAFLAIGLVASMGLALLAREVILVLAVGLAPIMLIMGGMSPMRWLAGLWTKITTMALLLGPANALLLGVGAMVGQRAHQAGLGGGAMADRILGFLVALGVLSVLIGLNTMIGKTVYGAVIEIAEKAGKSTMAVVNLAAIAVGAAAAPAIGGLVGGGSAAASGVAEAGGGAMASGLSGVGGAHSQAMGQARLTASIGQAVGASGLPGARGFQTGMNLGAAGEAYKQVRQGVGEGIGGAAGWKDSSLDAGRAVGDARAEILERYGTKGGNTALAQTGVPLADIEDRLGKGAQLAENSYAALPRLGLDTGTVLRDLNYRGESLQGAATGFARATIGGYGLGNRSDYHMPIMTSRFLPERYHGADWMGAVRIATSLGPSGTRGQAPDAEMIELLTRAVHHRRVQLGETVDEIVSSASKAAGMREWLRGSYERLPDREVASDLGKAIGL
jgi:hypothetical protein